MVNMSHIKTLVTVVEEEKVSTAAQKLFVTQPALSQHIQALEDYFGIAIFNRRRRKLELTEAGVFIYHKAKELLKECYTFENSVSNHIMSIKKKINIVAGPLMSDYILPYVIAYFKRDHPEIDVAVEPSETDLIIRGILDYTYDIGFIGIPVKHNRLNVWQWVKDELVVIFPPNHPLSLRQDAVLPEELIAEPVIWHKGVTGIKQYVQQQLRLVGVDLAEIRVAMEASSTASVLTSVEAGLGFSVISRLAARKNLQLGLVTAVPLKGVSLDRYLYVVAHKLRRMPQPVEEFLKFSLDMACDESFIADRLNGNQAQA